jgi:hypothetical protein|nr:MAG TPA: hypothetical protein [Caudoviricetes sp.]
MFLIRLKLLLMDIEIRIDLLIIKIILMIVLFLSPLGKKDFLGIPPTKIALGFHWIV